jgi:hypothetical protein
LFRASLNVDGGGLQYLFDVSECQKRWIHVFFTYFYGAGKNYFSLIATLHYQTNSNAMSKQGHVATHTLAGQTIYLYYIIIKTRIHDIDEYEAIEYYYNNYTCMMPMIIIVT